MKKMAACRHNRDRKCLLRPRPVQHVGQRHYIIERTMQRSGLEREAVQRIMATQASRAQRRAAADIVVDNSTLTLVQLRALAEQLARQLPL